MKFFLTAPVSDLERTGLDDTLSALAGDIGLDAVCVRAVSDARAVAFQNPAGDVQFAEYDDGACFHPDPRLYTGTRIRPHTQNWIKHRNPLDTLARAVEKNRLALRIRLSCCYQPTVAQRNSMLTCVNILGAASRTWLCPSHPEVREYLCALAEDVGRNYAPEMLEFEHANFAEYRSQPAAFVLPEAGADLTPLAEMLSWCFCASCRERMTAGGLDAAEIVQQGLERLGNALNIEENAALDSADWLTNDPQLQELRELRSQAISTLLNSIAQRAHTDTAIVHSHGISDKSIPGAAILYSLIEYNDPRPPHRDPCPVYRAYPPTCPDGPTLVAAVHAAATQKYDHIGFADYGLLTPVSLDWVRQAIRFAKRAVP